MTFLQHIFGRKKGHLKRVWPTKDGYSFGQTYCKSCNLIVRFPVLMNLADYLERKNEEWMKRRELKYHV